MTDAGEKSLLDKLLASKDASYRQAMSYAQVAHMVEQNREAVRSGRMHRAQVEAMWKCKAGEHYTPPDEEEEVSPTLINCSFNGDQAVSQITQAIADIETPPPPPTTPAPPNGKLPRWALWLLTVLAILIGAGLIFLAWYLMADGDRAVYEIVAQPYEPPTN